MLHLNGGRLGGLWRFRLSCFYNANSKQCRFRDHGEIRPRFVENPADLGLINRVSASFVSR